MTHRLLLLLAFDLMLVSCADGQRSLSQPSSVPIPEFPAPRLLVRIDVGGSAVAIVGVSQVTFDARTTPGDKLQYEIQFGDGQSASAAVSTHVFESGGTFTATLTVTDAAGRRASVSQIVLVKSLESTWFHLGYSEGSKRAEVHRLTITTQQGPILRGVYSSLGSGSHPLTGTLTGEREVRLTVADQSLEFQGTVLSEVLAEDQHWPLKVRGGSADGMTLPFQPVIGVPVGLPPIARLAVRWDHGMTEFPTMGLTSTTFDASESTGDRLSYVIEYGDGAYTSEGSGVHRSDRAGELLARVTVVDRFARVDVTSTRFDVRSLTDSRGSHWFHHLSHPTTGRFEFREIVFVQHEGSYVSGFYMHPEEWRSHFTGTVGESGIRLKLDDGTIEFTGTVKRPRSSYDWRMSLFVRGGSADGLTLDFFWDDGPG